MCLHVPALATVGLTQSAAEERGIPFRVEVNNMQNWLSGRTYAETAAWAKVLIDKQTDRIVGAPILGHAGEELIHIFALFRPCGARGSPGALAAWLRGALPGVFALPAGIGDVLTGLFALPAAIARCRARPFRR